MAQAPNQCRQSDEQLFSPALEWSILFGQSLQPRGRSQPSTQKKPTPTALSVIHVSRPKSQGAALGYHVQEPKENAKNAGSGRFGTRVEGRTSCAASQRRSSAATAVQIKSLRISQLGSEAAAIHVSIRVSMNMSAHVSVHMSVQPVCHCTLPNIRYHTCLYAFP